MRKHVIKPKYLRISEVMLRIFRLCIPGIGNKVQSAI